MGTADLKAAFNSVAEPRYAARKATLGYSRADGAEWQIITFYGTGADGVAFEVSSDPLSPGVDVVLAARTVAQNLLDRMEPLS